jgi:hypothetical protein
MHLSSDDLVFWQHGWLKLNETIVTTWGLMLLMVPGAWLITRKLSTEIEISGWQAALEIIVAGIKNRLKKSVCRSRKNTSDSSARCFYSLPRPISLRFFRYTNRPRVRFPRRPRSP